VFAELSGGLDSSSIVCMASSLIRAGDVVAPRLQTISYVFEDCDTVDDSRWIAHVERHLGARTIRVRGDEHPYLTGGADTSRFATLNPALIHSAYVSAVADHMQRAGARLLLSGVGGDEVLHSRNNPDPELGDLLYQRQFRALCCRTFTWSRLLRQPYAHLLWRGAIWPMLPAGFRATVPGAYRRVPVWVAPEFARRGGLARRLVDTPELAAFKQPSARYQAAGFLSAVKQIAAGHRQELGGFHTTYPYLDRRLVEFLQAVPFEQKVRPGESRSLMRRSLRHLLPPEIAARRGKSSPSEATARAFAREWPRLRSLLEDGLLVDRGYADRRKLRDALVHARTGWTGSAHLTSAVLLECWLRTLDDRRAGAVDRIAAAGSPALAVAVCDGAAPRLR
jgi:asparagine synthase (glutamine-hydrolysing)